MPAITRIYDLCSDLLDYLVTYFSGQGHSLPDRRYVAAGEVAFDCEQITIGMLRSFQGIPGHETNTRLDCATRTRSLEFGALVVRCVPTFRTGSRVAFPSVDELNGSSRTLMTDAWLLTAGTKAAYDDNAFLDVCSSLAILDCAPVGPSGGFGGMLLTMQAMM